MREDNNMSGLDVGFKQIDPHIPNIVPLHR